MPANQCVFFWTWVSLYHMLDLELYHTADLPLSYAAATSDLCQLKSTHAACSELAAEGSFLPPCTGSSWGGVPFSS